MLCIIYKKKHAAEVEMFVLMFVNKIEWVPILIIKCHTGTIYLTIYRIWQLNTIFLGCGMQSDAMRSSILNWVIKTTMFQIYMGRRKR